MADADDRPQGPRTFLLYCWSCPEHEDWVLAGLRYEMHALIHAFAEDVPKDLAGD